MAELETIVSLNDRPDLVPVVARWIVDAFSPDDASSLEKVTAHLRRGAGERLANQKSFVLLVGDVPVATASLEPDDLDTRPDLTPWLASVYVAPAARGHGRAAKLVAAVENAARDAQVGTLWLYTSTAEHLYVRLGWQTAERFERKGKATVVMRRDLTRLDPPMGCPVPAADACQPKRGTEGCCCVMQ